MSESITGIQSSGISTNNSTPKTKCQRAKEQGITVFTFDNDNDGKINTEELDNYLKYIDSMSEDDVEEETVEVEEASVEQEEVADVVEEEVATTNPNFDINGDGELDFAEHIAQFLYNVAEQTPEYDKRFDFNGDGKLGISEKLSQITYGVVSNLLSSQAKDTAEEVSEEEATEEDSEQEITLTTFDANNDGTIDEEERSNYLRWKEVSGENISDEVTEEEATEKDSEQEITLTTFDANNDGEIDEEEHNNYLRWKEALGENASNEVEAAVSANEGENPSTSEVQEATSQEIAEATNGDLEQEITLMTFDANNDGKIDTEELNNFMRWKEVAGKDESEKVENSAEVEEPKKTIEEELGLEEIPESLEDNLSYDENGNLLLTFDKWDGSKGDNIDCPSRLMKQVYGESYDWANEKSCNTNKLFEALMELNGVKPSMYAYQTITLYSKEDLQAYIDGTKTKEEIKPIHKDNTNVE